MLSKAQYILGVRCYYVAPFASSLRSAQHPMSKLQVFQPTGDEDLDKMIKDLRFWG